jgi:hypothetical protein
MKGGSGRSLDRRSSIQPRVPFSGVEIIEAGESIWRKSLMKIAGLKEEDL